MIKNFFKYRVLSYAIISNGNEEELCPGCGCVCPCECSECDVCSPCKDH
ncbi:hypothetical protein EW15_0076 [Prochlorococcus sp. MIT 0801]|nr:hypothetical protein EW15_0076 [Prochlorococcus sp. MIT 0801]